MKTILGLPEGSTTMTMHEILERGDGMKEAGIKVDCCG